MLNEHLRSVALAGLLSTAVAACPSTSQEASKGKLLQLPLVFERLEDSGAFACRSAGYSASVSGRGLDFHVSTSTGPASWSLRFDGAAAAPPAVGLSPQIGRVHRFVGSNPDKWRRNLELFGRVRLVGLYPNVDLAVHGRGRRLEYDFVLQPGARVSNLRLRLEHVDSWSLEEDGSLSIRVAGAPLTVQAPIAYQEKAGIRTPVDCRYECNRDGSIGFVVGSHDSNEVLVIDPVLQYGSFLGGSGPDVILDYERDANGNDYFCGYTQSTNFPVKGGVQAALKGAYDAFVAKVDGKTQTLAWATYLGGSGGLTDYERAIALTVDGSGNVIVTGRTNATDFPVLNALQSKLAGNYDAFVTKISADGSRLLYSTYLGGSAADNASANSTFAQSAYGGDIALDPFGNAVVVGTTFSNDFPTRIPLQKQLGGVADAFLTVMDSQGKLIASTFFGGSLEEQGRNILVDRSGLILLAGATVSKDFPVTTGTFRAQKIRGFASKLTPLARVLLRSMTFDAAPSALDVDSAGNVYLAGGTTNPNFPVTRGVLQTRHKGATSHRSGIEAFVSKLDPGLSKLVYSTYYGIASSDESVSDLQVDASGHAVLALSIASGRSTSTFSTRLAKLNPFGSAMSYEYTIPAVNTSPAGLELDSSGTIHIAGITDSSSFPVTAGAFQSTLAGRAEGFVARYTDPASALSALTFELARLERGKQMLGVVTLDGRATSSPVTVPITFQSTGGISMPSAAVVPVGASSASFMIQSQAAAPLQTVTVTAAWGTSSVRGSFEVWDGPEYRIRYLGSMGGQNKVYGYGVNNLGASTGTASNPSFSFDIFLHNDTKGIRSLGPGGGAAINDAGQIAGSVGRSAIIWDPKASFTVLPLPNQSTWGAATALNANGAVVGWYTGANGNLAFLWTKPTGSIGLGHLGGNGSTAYGVNDDGVVVGEAFLSTGMKEAFRWDATNGIKSLGVLPNHNYSTATAINNAGEVVGVSAPLRSQSQEAFLHVPGKGMRGIGHLQGHVKSLAYDINDHGQVVGFSAKSTFSEKSAVMYDAARGMRRLADLIDPDELFGWDLQEARSVNEHGQIVGNGTFTGNAGTFSAFRLDPIGFVAYGAGCAGGNGKAPVLSGIGVPRFARNTELALSHAQANSFALLYLGGARASVPLPGGCTLFVGSPLLALGFAHATDSAGRTRIPLHLPNGSGPLRIVFQMLVLDRASANGLFTASNGLEMEVR